MKEVSKADGVPSSIRQWREQNGGAHSVMASAFVKKGGTKDDVKKGLEKAAKSV